MDNIPDMDNHILIVDDEPRLTSSFEILFKNKGFSVQTAGNGYDAISLFKEQPAKVVITDIQMDRMDGIQLMQELKKIDPCVQIIFLTGYTSVQSAADALKQNNAFEYLAKPIKNNEELFEITRRAQKKYDLEKNLFFKHQKTEKEFSLFKNILDNMEAITYVADMQTYDLVYANKKFLQVFNENRPFPKGAKCWQILQKDQSGPCSFCTNKRLLQPDGSPGKPYEWEFQNTRNHRWYNIVDKAIPWYDKRIVRLESAIDITEKKENEKLFRNFEKAIETSKKLESIATLAGGVAHDFNNSLSTVIGNINLAQLNSTNEDTQKFLKNAENGVMQAKGVSSKLITFTKGGGPAKVKTDIGNMIESLLKRHLEPDKITYAFECEPIGSVFYSDQNQLKAAFRSIIQNAVESIENKGHISVTVNYEEAALKNAQIIVSITDTGCGISNDHIDMIFNPYFTTKPMDSRKSTGLGLSIAWSTISRHGGLIHVESDLGKGSTVHVTLPVFKENGIEKPVETPQEPKRNTLSHETPKRVLVMDDDELILDVISQLLKRLGYETLSASNGNKAVETCRAAQKRNEKIHIALLDFDIHHGMGGLPTMEALKKIDPDIQGLLITGHTDDMAFKGYKSSGFSAMIEKPFSITQLNEKIESLF